MLKLQNFVSKLLQRGHGRTLSSFLKAFSWLSLSLDFILFARNLIQRNTNISINWFFFKSILQLSIKLCQLTYIELTTCIRVFEGCWFGKLQGWKTKFAQITKTKVKIRSNYRDENKNRLKLQGQITKFAQITRTKFKIKKCENRSLIFIFYLATTTIGELFSPSEIYKPHKLFRQKNLFFQRQICKTLVAIPT
jgi:hypothetical protein